MQPRSRRAVIALDALGLAALAVLFVLWCVRTPGLSVPGGIAAGCSAALFAAVGLRFVPVWVRFWQRTDAAPAAVPTAEPVHMGARIFAALLALDLVLLLLTWGVRALAGRPETLTQALEFWRCLDSRHYLDIARDGYIAAGDPDRVVQLVFLPGYPLVVRAVMRLIPSDICAGCSHRRCASRARGAWSTGCCGSTCRTAAPCARCGFSCSRRGAFSSPRP